MIVDRDQRSPGRHPVDRVEPSVVDAFGAHDRSEPFTGFVVADVADERHRGTGTRGGDRLVQTFSTRVLRVLGSTDRLAGTGDALRADHEVEVEAADDHDVDVSHRRNPDAPSHQAVDQTAFDRFEVRHALHSCDLDVSGGDGCGETAVLIARRADDLVDLATVRFVVEQ